MASTLNGSIDVAIDCDPHVLIFNYQRIGKLVYVVESVSTKCF